MSKIASDNRRLWNILWTRCLQKVQIETPLPKSPIIPKTNINKPSVIHSKSFCDMTCKLKENIWNMRQIWHCNIIHQFHTRVILKDYFSKKKISLFNHQRPSLTFNRQYNSTSQNELDPFIHQRTLDRIQNVLTFLYIKWRIGIYI